MNKTKLAKPIANICVAKTNINIRAMVRLNIEKFIFGSNYALIIEIMPKIKAKINIKIMGGFKRYLAIIFD